MFDITWLDIKYRLSDFWWYWQYFCGKQCPKRDRFAWFQRSVLCKISCWYEFLNHWAKMEYEAYSLEHLKLVRKFYLGYSSQLEDIDVEIARYLMESYIKPENAKNKRERQFVYSGRSYYLQNAPTVDKFKNKSSVKAQKHR
jgi:hypothetical protein